MEYLPTIMLMSVSALLVVTAVLVIISTMRSKAGVKWWIIGSVLQSLACILTFIFLINGQGEIGLMVFFTLFMGVTQTVCLGTLRFIDVEFSIIKRLITLLIAVGLVAISAFSGLQFTAELIFVSYASIVVFQTAYHIWHYEDSDAMLNLVGLIFVAIGIHILDYLVLGKYDWFLPIGFMLALVLSLLLFFTLVIVSILQFKKITKESEDKAIRAATHDPLTGLYNRSYLETLFTQYQAKAASAQSTFVLLYIDLDGFKAVNDSYGHKAGDVILQVAAKRFKGWLGSKGDALRIGGDELVILKSLNAEAGPGREIIYGTSAAENILKLIEKPITDGTDTFNISASIGGCYYDPELSDLENMLSETDKLMYKAKKSGGRQVCFGKIPRSSATDLPEPVTVGIMV